MDYLDESDIPFRIYYPIPLHRQQAYKQIAAHENLPVSEMLSKEVISLPIHSEIDGQDVGYITDKIKAFFAKL